MLLLVAGIQFSSQMKTRKIPQLQISLLLLLFCNLLVLVKLLLLLLLLFELKKLVVLVPHGVTLLHGDSVSVISLLLVLCMNFTVSITVYYCLSSVVFVN